jgi:alpha-L-fucosidase 2
MGQPLDETVILSNGRLFMPWERPLAPVNTGAHLEEIRRLLAEGKYQQAADFVVELSRLEGYGTKRWTDPLISAFDLRIPMEQAGAVRGYGRTLDFTDGTAAVRWEDDRGASEYGEDRIALELEVKFGIRTHRFPNLEKLFEEPSPGTVGL